MSNNKLERQYASWFAVQCHVLDGILERPNHCTFCSKLTPDVEFHHKDYDYHPDNLLEGVWLCRSCHRKEHEKMKRKQLTQNQL